MRTTIFAAAAALALSAAPLELNAQGRVGDRVQGRVEDARARGTDQRGRTARGSDRDRRDERGSARGRDDARGSATGTARGNRNERRDDRDFDIGRTQARQNPPPFCRRGGAGHPVHGWRWCQEKGYASGTLRWERAPWGDVVMRNPRRAERQSVGGSVLGDILGDVVFGRVDSQRRALGITQGLVGRWERDGAGHAVLRLSAGGVPVAEFIDRSGNNRADIVRINTGR